MVGIGLDTSVDDVVHVPISIPAEIVIGHRGPVEMRQVPELIDALRQFCEEIEINLLPDDVFVRPALRIRLGERPGRALDELPQSLRHIVILIGNRGDVPDFARSQLLDELQGFFVAVALLLEVDDFQPLLRLKRRANLCRRHILRHLDNCHWPTRVAPWSDPPFDFSYMS